MLSLKLQHTSSSSAAGQPINFPSAIINSSVLNFNFEFSQHYNRIKFPKCRTLNLPTHADPAVLQEQGIFAAIAASHINIKELLFPACFMMFCIYLPI